MPTSRSLPKALRAQVLVPGALCHWCGGVATECDHLIEHDAGGTDDLDNLVPSCKRCNTRRGALYVNKKIAAKTVARAEAMQKQKTNGKNQNEKSDFFTGLFSESPHKTLPMGVYELASLWEIFVIIRCSNKAIDFMELCLVCASHGPLPASF